MADAYREFAEVSDIQKALPLTHVLQVTHVTVGLVHFVLSALIVRVLHTASEFVFSTSAATLVLKLTPASTAWDKAREQMQLATYAKAMADLIRILNSDNLP